MKAARAFLVELEAKGLFESARRIEVELFGSLALTGKGHGTHTAILLGLMGETPEEVDVDAIPSMIEGTLSTKRLHLLGRHEIDFDASEHLHFNSGVNPYDFSSVVRFEAFDEGGDRLLHDV